MGVDSKSHENWRADQEESAGAVQGGVDRLDQAVEAVQMLVFQCEFRPTGNIRDALRPFFEEQPSVEVDLDLDQRIAKLWGNLSNHDQFVEDIKALAAELQAAPRSLDDLIEGICASSEEQREGSFIYLDDLEKILRHHIRALPAPRVSDALIEAAVGDAVGEIWDEGMSHASLRRCLKRHFQPKSKPQEPRVWPEGKPYPEDWVSVEEWVPLQGSSWVLVDTRSNGVGVARWSVHQNWPDKRGTTWPVTHWCRLKAGPSA